MSNSEPLNSDTVNRPKVTNFDQLVVTTELPLSVVLEYAGLCIEGRVRTSSIEARRRTYEVEAISDREISFRPSAVGPAIMQEDELADMQKLMIGFQRLNADVRIVGRWAIKFPSPQFLQNIPAGSRITTLTQCVHVDCHLSLSDLDEISAWMQRLAEDKNAVVSDPDFQKAFPCEFSDCFRHRTGNQVNLYRNSQGQVESHRIDAPNPAAELYSLWNTSLKRKPQRSSGDESTRWTRWRLAKMLGGIPENRKCEVFNWVSDTMWRIEEYHSTHGRQPISQTLEYYFDNCVIFANQNMEFEIIQM